MSKRHQIVTTKAIIKEIYTAMATAICGHPPDELSPGARKVFAEMERLDFKVDLVPKIESPKAKQ